jgi:hypothetical protein
MNGSAVVVVGSFALVKEISADEARLCIYSEYTSLVA